MYIIGQTNSSSQNWSPVPASRLLSTFPLGAVPLTAPRGAAGSRPGRMGVVPPLRLQGALWLPHASGGAVVPLHLQGALWRGLGPPHAAMAGGLGGGTGCSRKHRAAAATAGMSRPQSSQGNVSETPQLLCPGRQGVWVTV